MAKRIQAAVVSVDLVAKSSSFSEALDKIQRDAAKSSNGVIKSLGAMESASKSFEKKMNAALWAPFKAFKTATAPLTIGLKQIQNSLANVLRPFKNLAVYVSGPFVDSFNQAKKAVTSIGGVLVDVTKKAGLAALALTAGFAAMMIGSVNSALEINKLANKLGITYKSLNSIGFVAASVGVSTEQVADSMKDLTAKIEDAAYAGSGALEPFFTRINQSALEWKKLDPAEQLLRFSEELSKMDYQSALYWADEINDSMSDMAPLLYKGRGYFEAMRKEAELFGSSVNGIDGLKELSTVASRIQYTLRNMFSGIAGHFAPILLAGFDKGMERFKTYIVENGGFERVITHFSKKLLDTVANFLNAIQSSFNFIKNTFGSFIEFNNKLVDQFGGQKRLTGDASEPRQKLIDTADNDFKDSQKAQYRAEVLTKQLEQLQSIRTLRADFSNEERVAHFERVEMVKQQLKEEQRIADLYDYRLEQYNEQIDLANKERGAKPQEELIGDRFKTFVNNAFSSNGSGSVNQDPKKIAASNARQQANNDAETNMMSVLGKDYKGQELALNAAKTTQDQMIEMLREQQDKSMSINEAYDKKKSLLDETSKFRVAQLEADKTYAVEMGQVDQLESIQKRIDEEKGLNEQALLGLEANRQKELLINEQSQAARLKSNRTFRQALLQIDIENGLKKDLAYSLELEREYDSLEQLYNDKLALMINNNEIETEEYRKMLADKEEALNGFYERKRQLAIADSQQEVADNENSLTATWARLDDDYSAKVDASVAGTDLKISEMDEMSTIGADLTAQAKANNVSEAEQKEANLKRQKDATVKMAGSVLEEAAKNNKTMFKMNQAFQISNAVMDTYAGASKALAQFGMPMGPIMAGLITAAGIMNVQQIKSQKYVGKAHKGQTEIDGTGDQSWILQGGERIVSKEQNVDLKNYLKKADSNSNSNGGVAIYQTNTINSNKDNDAIELFLLNNPKVLRKALANL
uniref:hypothetical protein n=1 Tax=Shewanella sp. TaxID=50422 RepID=UPI004048A073